MRVNRRRPPRLLHFRGEALIARATHEARRSALTCLECVRDELERRVTECCRNAIHGDRRVQRLVRRNNIVPLEGLEPPTVCLGRNCSSIELQRLARPV